MTITAGPVTYRWKDLTPQQRLDMFGVDMTEPAPEPEAEDTLLSRAQQWLLGVAVGRSLTERQD